MPRTSSLLTIAVLRVVAQFILFVSTSTAIPLAIPGDLCVWLDGTDSGIYPCNAIVKAIDVPGAKLSVFVMNGVQANSIYPDDAVEAVKAAMAVYKDFTGGKKLNLLVYVVPTMTTGRPNTYALTNLYSDTCRTQIATQVPSDPSIQVDELSFKQTIAHEMYHCIEFLSGKIADTTQAPAAKWWHEGLATYFADTIYPHAPKGWIEDYRPTTPLYETSNVKGNGQPAAIYFEYLRNLGWTDKEMNDFMVKQTFVDSFPEELSRVSLETDLAATFPSFASRFLDKQIHDIENTDFGSVYIYDVKYKKFDVPDTLGGKLYDEHLSITPWNIESALKTSFDANKIVSMTLSIDDPADDRTTVQYRKKGDLTWQTLQPGKTVDLQNTDTTVCPTVSTEWNFLATSTFDPKLGSVFQDDFAHATLSFSVTEPPTKRDSCTKPPPVNGNTPDQCLVGNWKLDDSSMESFLAKALSVSASTAKINNIVVGGSSTFSVTSSFASTMTFSHLTISYDGSAEGISFHTDIDISGSVIGSLAAVAGGTSPTFTWATAVSSGTADTTTTVAGLGDSIPLNVSLDGEYGNETNVLYQCTGNSLSMTGYVAGKYVWAYSWIKT